MPPDPIPQDAIADTGELREMTKGKYWRQGWVNPDNGLAGCDGGIQNRLRNAKLLGLANVGLRLPIFHLL